MTTRQLVATVCRKLSRLFARISNRIDDSIQIPSDQRYQAWFDQKGDQTFRLNYDLTPNSTVFDLGGYEGQWSSDIFAKFCCRLMIFEPVEQYAESIKIRFSHNDKIEVYNFGLSKETCSVEIGIAENCSSVFNMESQKQQVNLVKAEDFIEKHNIEVIDLIKINIEGGEYDLLDHLIESKLILKFKNIQVQFHDFVPSAKERMLNIQSELEKTHALTYQFPFVWENWKLR